MLLLNFLSEQTGLKKIWKVHLPKSVIALVFLIIEKTIFLSILGLRMYFIYHGDVLSRFEKKRTNFLSYEESITELPTLVVGVVDTSGFC